MPTTAPATPVRRRAAARPLVVPYRVAAAGLVAASTLFHLAYLLLDCPLDLAPDEAHYWHWSRHLDWSYYSKGPLVAWLVRASCDLFGPASVWLTGTEMPAVRLPAVACHAALLAGLYALASDTAGGPRAGFLTVGVALTLPAVHAAAVVMTIDPPFLAVWCWALVAAWRAVSRDSVGWWLAAGLCVAVGVLAKYPALLFPPAVGLYLAATPERRGQLKRPGFWAMVGVAALGCVPVVAWNAANDWVGVRHVVGQAGGGYTARPPAFRPFGPVAFAAGQFGFLLGFWFVALAAACWRFRHSAGSVRFLWFLTLPVWSVFFLASFRTAGQVNWPAAAYLAGLPLAVLWVRTRTGRPAKFAARVSLAAGLVLSAAVLFPGLVRPAVAALAGPPTAANPIPARRLDPTCRLQGWRTLAAAVDDARDRVRRETGQDAVVAGMIWTTPGELSFYCRGHPEAYSFGLALADRHSQYDLWRPNPVADAQAFRGRSFVYVGEEIPDMGEVFDRIEPPLRVTHTAGGVPVASWTVWVARGFRGFPTTRLHAVGAGY